VVLYANLRTVMKQEIIDLLDRKVQEYNQLSFIENDPICIPHQYNKKQDIEIMGLFAAVFAWGQRKTIINKCRELAQRMDNAPYDFVLNHTDADLQKLIGFKHRTFNDSDLLYFIYFLNYWYKNNTSLESAFSNGMQPGDLNTENGLNDFKQTFFSLDEVLQRTMKHISSPIQKSACKRINMYLRWMVRHDEQGVDFGIWKKIKPAQLVCPLDVHVQRVAANLGLIQREQNDWNAAVELTNNLKKLDSEDPVKYDFALFGLGVMDKY
jgi:uncharacterized protein (TIGR02757 family)